MTSVPRRLIEGVLHSGCLFIAAVACGSSDAVVDDTATQNPATEVRTEVTLVIDGMACEACAARIEKELVEVDGVREVSVKFAETRARIVFDPGRVTASDLDQAVDSLGFESRIEPQ